MKTYQVRKFDSTLERRIVIGLITSDQFLTQVHGILDPQYFQVPAMRSACEWCLNFYNQYSKAPGIHFQDIFQSKVRSGELPKEHVEEIDSIYSTLSKEYLESGIEVLNAKYLVHQSERLMRARSILALGQDIISLASEDQVDEAELALSSYTPIQREGVLWSNPIGGLTDEQLSEVFNDSAKNVLFRMNPVLQNLMGGPVERDSFIGLQAPEKRGKTWWLWEFAYRALFGHCNVAFFSMGDMSEAQNWRRILGRALRSSKRWGGKMVRYPIADCLYNQLGTCEKTDIWKGEGQYPVLDQSGRLIDDSEHAVCTECRKKYPRDYWGTPWYTDKKVEEWNEGNARQVLQRLSRKLYGKSIRLQCYPSFQANVRTIRRDLDLWEKRDGWVADVVVIDYADILAPEDGRESEMRHKINTTWGSLRGLSTERSIAVITATQAARSSYTKTQQDLSDTSEDKRKLGHVTCMLALNQTLEEKRSKIMRVSNLLMRDGFFDSEADVTCLQCLEMSTPILDCYEQKKPRKDDHKGSSKKSRR